MNIGEASKASKVPVKMIRCYEQIGLIPLADQNDPGHRAYSQDDVHWLYFIRCTCDLGFLVARITDLLGLWNDKPCRSADVKRLAQQHISELDWHITSMLEMAEALKIPIRCYAGGERPDRPILRTLEQPDISDDEPEARTSAVPRRASGSTTTKKPHTY